MIKITTTKMAKILRVPTPDEMDERFSEFENTNYGDAYHAALEEGFSVEEAEEKALLFEQKERDREIEKYSSRIVEVFETEALQLDLEVTPLKTRPGEFRLSPRTSWLVSASKMRVAVNGITGFWFQNTREFLDSGPYTACSAVQNHLGYIGELWDLYGYSSPRNRVMA